MTRTLAIAGTTLEMLERWPRPPPLLTVRGTLAQRERTSDHIVIAAQDHVRALDLGWRGYAPFDIGLGFAKAAVWSPYQIADYFFVLSIAVKDGIDILNCDWPQQETGGLEGIWWHVSELREALEPSRVEWSQSSVSSALRG